jgi:exportin-2 (importin alpha re-exporter)
LANKAFLINIAEIQLSSAEKMDGFPAMLLQVIQSNNNASVAAALYFKNYVKRFWADLPDNDKDIVKLNIVQLMITAPASIQNQLSDAVTIIADSDFPAKWQSLIPDLVQKLSFTDMSANIGVLQTAHSIFKRWRKEFRSDKLFSEINLVLQTFASPFLEFLKTIDQHIDASSSNPKDLSILLNILLILIKIFYDFNCHDLPEFFEDHQEQFMLLFHKYLVYENPSLPIVLHFNIG